MSSKRLRFSVDGVRSDIVAHLGKHRFFVQGVPVRVSVNRKNISPSEAWLETVLEDTEGDVFVAWAAADGDRYGGRSLQVLGESGVVLAYVPDSAPSLEDASSLALSMSMEVMTLGPAFAEWNERVPKFSFSSGHTRHGWGALFKARGHERLVSRRWLDHGPWRKTQVVDDVSAVQFHDLDADLEAAWLQSVRAHERMGLADVGGYVHPGHEIRTRISGLYKASDRSLTITRGNGQPMSQREMLDLCAYRSRMRTDDKEPIERVRVVFIEERDARRHLHELWLRELECVYFDEEGREVRADDSYQPERIVPEWVERCESIVPAARPAVARLSLGLSGLLDNPEGELPGGWSRDDLLFHITDHHKPTPSYSVREVMGAHISRVSASEGEEGELVITAAQGEGGAMRRDEATPLLAKVHQVPAHADVWVRPERLGLTLPAIIVPDPYLDQRPMKLGEEHPLRGVTIHAVGDVLARVRSLNREDLRDVEALLRLCADDRFVLSVVSA